MQSEQLLELEQGQWEGAVRRECYTPELTAQFAADPWVSTNACSLLFRYLVASSERQESHPAHRHALPLPDQQQHFLLPAGHRLAL